MGKRHVLQLGDGLFVGEAEKLAAAHRDIELREVDVDAMAADLVMRPERYDVILTSNMFGDILSNEAVALSGGLGLAAALNVGERHAVANAGHGSAPDIAGRNIANPTGLMLSCAMLLEWLGSGRNLSGAGTRRARSPRPSMKCCNMRRAGRVILVGAAPLRALAKR